MSFNELPGSLFSPFSYAVIVTVALLTIPLASWASKDHKRMMRMFLYSWIFFLTWEIVIILWDALGGDSKAFDYSTQLSLYPCSLYLYTMPFVLWAHGDVRWTAMSYFGTLGLVGALVNLGYPALADYSVLSFAGLHTVLYHANLLFTLEALLMSGDFSYRGIHMPHYLFLPCIPSLLLSIPANLVNFSPIGSDYMYFTGAFPLLAKLFPTAARWQVTFFMYSLYILIPTLFFLPSYLNNNVSLPIGTSFIFRSPLQHHQYGEVYEDDVRHAV